MFFDLTVALIHGFRMQLFFLLAGFFAALVADRRGFGELLRNRARRIGVPFLVGMVTLIPLTLGTWMWAARATGAELVTEHTGARWPTAHLWFLQYLLVYYVAAGLFGRLGKGMLQGSWRRRGMWLVRSDWKLLLLPVATFGLLFGGPAVGEVEEAGAQFLPGGRGLLYYGCYFAVGWLVYRCRSAMEAWRGLHLRQVGVSMLAFALYGICADQQYRLGVQGPLSLVVGNLAAEVFAWTVTFLCLGLAMKRFQRPRAWARYLADASYWFYLAHLPLVIALQAVVAPGPGSALRKCAVVVGVTTLLLWGSYQWCVRYTLIGRVLNGRRAR